MSRWAALIFLILYSRYRSAALVAIVMAKKAKVTLLNGSEKTDVDLAPSGDKFEAKGSYKVAKGTKGIASVTLPGKPAAVARFEIK